MKVYYCFISLLLLVLSTTQAAASGVLSIKIDNSGQYQGQVNLALYQLMQIDVADAEWDSIPIYKTLTPKLLGEDITLTVPELSTGEYAIRLFVDENNNQTLDTSILGIPVEAVGFSNNPNLTLGEPSIADVKFMFDLEHSQQVIRLTKNKPKRLHKKH